MTQELDARKLAELQVRVAQIRDKLTAMQSEVLTSMTAARADLAAAIEDLGKLISHLH